MKYYIGHSNEQEIRYRAASGGIGTSIIKYLMDSGKYGTSMTFIFNKSECKYEPKLIYDFSDYNNCGSIYQDTDNIGFIRENLENIKNGIIVTCMPCQVDAIKHMLSQKGIKCFVVSFSCSGQTTIEGTWLYYKLLGIDKNDVCNIQYRGNGWPSGIQISLKNGEIVRKDNYTYPWTLMHKSLLYRPKRCLFCGIKTNPHSDVSLADPWLPKYIGKDINGNTVVISNSIGSSLLDEMVCKNLVALKEVNEEVFIESQLGTIETKKESVNHKSFNKLVAKMGREGSFYKSLFTSSARMLNCHIKLMKKIRKIM
jgi:coenzyme F420-reducing hydrogenase beta subunit